MRCIGRAVFLLCMVGICLPSPLHAQELVQDQQTVMRAEVLEVLESKTDEVPGIGAKEERQVLRVRVVSGEEKGAVLSVENDYTPLRKGEEFYLVHVKNDLEGRDAYTVSDPYRLPYLYALIGLFVVCVLVFGGVQGLRGLVSLAASLGVIVYILFPAILGGVSPLLASAGVAALIIIIGSYITHGINKTTSAAVLGMLLAVVVSGALASLSVSYAHLTGFESEEATYLNFNTEGTLDFQGLLLGSILIGLLGVLYDSAISQAIAVEELAKIAPHVHRRRIFTRALRMGREHIGALVNILAIAYVGAALPLLLLFYHAGADFFITLNRELFAVEIVRAMVGSIGLVLAVPLTTVVATLILVKPRSVAGSETLKKEEEALEHAGHRH